MGCDLSHWEPGENEDFQRWSSMERIEQFLSVREMVRNVDLPIGMLKTSTDSGLDEKLSDIGIGERLPNLTVSGSPRSDFSFEEYAS